MHERKKKQKQVKQPSERPRFCQSGLHFFSKHIDIYQSDSKWMSGNQIRVTGVASFRLFNVSVYMLTWICNIFEHKVETK